MKKASFLLIFVTVAALTGFVLMGKKEAPPPPSSPTVSTLRSQSVYSAPTNFAHIGTITFDSPGNRQDTLYLVYEAPGAPALKVELVMDQFSVCATRGGAIPCMAMSASFGSVFGGKRAILEGVREKDDVVNVRKLTILEEGQREFTPQTGDVFVLWATMVEMIERCEFTELTQSHSLDVYATDKSGTRIRAVEPSIDELFKPAGRAKAACGDIRIATE